jgi:hypothetical protein
VNKKSVKKLRLNRETLRTLEETQLQNAAGGRVRPVAGDSNEISICAYCTTPLDSCPDTGTVA